MSLTLYNGDCLDIMKTLPDKSVDCFICDLPFGCLNVGAIKNPETNNKYKYKGGKGRSNTYTGCSWDVKINLEEFWIQVKRLCKNDSTPVLMFCTTRFGYELIKSNEKWFRYDLVWDKQRGVSFLSVAKMPMRSHEMIYVFSKKGAFYKRIDTTGDFKKWATKRPNQVSVQYGLKRTNTEGKEGQRAVLSVISNKYDRKTEGHPTEKPVELYKWLIERYCPAGGIVLDPTAGSFNSCFAGYELDRHAIGIEKDKGFFKKASDKADLLV